MAAAFTAPLYPAIPGEPCLTDPAPAIAYNAYPQAWNHQAVVPQFDYNFVAPSQVSASAFAVAPSVQYGYDSAQYVAAPVYPSYVQAAPQFQQYVSSFPVASPYVQAVPIDAAAPTVEAPVVTTVVEVVPLPEPVPFVPEPAPTTPAPTPAPTTELTTVPVPPAPTPEPTPAPVPIAPYPAPFPVHVVQVIPVPAPAPVPCPEPTAPAPAPAPAPVVILHPYDSRESIEIPDSRESRED